MPQITSALPVNGERQSAARASETTQARPRFASRRRGSLTPSFRRVLGSVERLNLALFHQRGAPRLAQGELRTAPQYAHLFRQRAVSSLNSMRLQAKGLPNEFLDHERSRQSITFSARARTDAGILSPRVMAALTFITNSTLADCATGISAGLAPPRILPA
jgi:hypothetical protein